MDQPTVVRLYSGAVALVAAATAAWAFQPHPPTGDRPAEQQTLYANVPAVDPGPPAAATAVDTGEALAYIRIPRFGSDWVWTVLEGTDMDTLTRGPGHFTGTALPGGRGNTAYAGHRSGHGEPFADFEALRTGDTVVLAQDGAEWTYRLTRDPTIIDPDEGWVVKNMRHGHWLTLVTCWPRYGSEKRLYVRAELTEVTR